MDLPQSSLDQENLVPGSPHFLTEDLPALILHAVDTQNAPEPSLPLLGRRLDEGQEPPSAPEKMVCLKSA